MAEHPERVRRRIAPDAVQLQVLLGSLLAGARIEGEAGERAMTIVHDAGDADYVWWKYDRLGALAAAAPEPRDGRIAFTTIAHPVFDDLALLMRSRTGARAAQRLLSPLGLAVWMSDRGRLRLRAEIFVPFTEGPSAARLLPLSA